MSKIIKARFVMVEEGCRSEQIVNLTQHSGTDTQKNNGLTSKTAEEIYAETKKMMEELMVEAQKEADSIMLAARAEAQQLLGEARAQAEKHKEEAMREGYEKGLAEGKQYSLAEASSLRESSAALLKKLEQRRLELFEDYEKVVLDLVFALTEKILGTAFNLRPELISAIVTKALQEVKDSEKTIVKVNPLHLPYLCGGDNQEDGHDFLQFVADPGLQPGDCILITENGFAEYLIHDQLAMLREALGSGL